MADTKDRFNLSVVGIVAIVGIIALSFFYVDRNKFSSLGSSDAQDEAQLPDNAQIESDTFQDLAGKAVDKCALYTKIANMYTLQANSYDSLIKKYDTLCIKDAKKYAKECSYASNLKTKVLDLIKLADQYNALAKAACSVVTITLCTDSDGGENYYKKGTTTYGPDSFTDYCGSGSQGDYVAEGWCPADGKGITSNVIFDCPNGCKDGACVNENTSSCTDTDGGNFPYLKGRVDAYITSSFTGKIERVEHLDLCVGNGTVENTTVIENYCNEERTNYNSVSFYCPNGCKDGACIVIGAK